jgi:ASC-1-like (ASCH) protein
MKFDIKTWALIILAGAFILYILFDKDPIPNESYVKEYESTIQRNESTIEGLKVKHQEDSLKSAQEVAQLKAKLSGKVTEVKKLSSTVAHLRANPVVVQVIADVPEIDSLVQSYDSLLESKDDQIELQGKLIVSLEDENKRITGNFIERLQLTEDNFQAQKAISDSYKNDLRKERRKVKLFKVIAVVGTVGGLLLGSQ